MPPTSGPSSFQTLPRQEPRKTRSLTPAWGPETEDKLLLAGFWLLTLLLFWSVLPIGYNGDFKYYLEPWVASARSGSLAYALRGEYSNYNPPYVYLLAILSRSLYWLSAVTVVKVISIVFVYIGAAAVWPLVATLANSRRKAWQASTFYPIVPTVFINAGIWGQADVVYISLLLWSLAFVVRNQLLKGCIFFSLALAFKLQAALIGPVFAYLLLSGRIGFSAVAMGGGVYVLALVPAYVAGRGLSDLLSIYLAQGETFHQLSKNAPNLYSYIQTLHLLSYQTGLVLGLAVVLAGVAVSLPMLKRRLQGSPSDLIILSLSYALLLPYFLPKMHDRYFALASVIAYVLAFMEGRWLIVFVLCEIGSMWAYTDFLLGYIYGPYIGALAMTAAIVSWALRVMPARGRSD